MRALDCQCGKHLEAHNDEELYGQAREHVDRDHPEMHLSDEQVQGIVAQGAAPNPGFHRRRCVGGRRVRAGVRDLATASIICANTRRGAFRWY